MQSKNNICTCGYFLKRVRDEGFYADRVFNDFGPNDNRRWVVVINPKIDSLFVTCVLKKNLIPDTYIFKFDDGGKKVPSGFHIDTSSMQVIFEYLNKYKINPINHGKEKSFAKTSK